MSKEKKSYRIFFAVELQPSLKIQLIDIQKLLASAGAVPVPPENFHITLSFLGNATEKQLEKIIDGIQPIPQSPFEVSLHDIIYWPKSTITALAIKDEKEQLLSCKKQLENQLSQLDFFTFDKRKYIPHITLFRQAKIPPKENLFFNARIKVDHFSLMVSQPTGSGVRYETLDSWPLLNLNIKQQLLGKS